MLCFNVYYIMVIVLCQVFVTCFLKVFCESFSSLLALVLLFWGVSGFSGGLRPRVFVFMGASVVFEAPCGVVGVFIWVRVC